MRMDQFRLRDNFASMALMKPHLAVKRLFSGFESRLLLRRVINFPRDSFDTLTRRRDPVVPPHGLWFVGGEKEYKAINEEFMTYFIELGRLEPDHCMLDVGCGIGIVASRLTKFMSPKGSYHGFDIVKIGIDWATKNISSRFPNFHFLHTDVFNKHYNPKGTLNSDSFAFPYKNATFDFVFLKSVFTHMLPVSVRRYLQEIRRVLKPGGRCLVTTFLLNDDSRELIRSGQSSLALNHDLGDCFVLDPRFPETAVALPEQNFREWCDEARLELLPPIHHGKWCGRDKHLSYQDIVLLSHRTADAI
jgi:SAM-dependent methyltransferase